MRNRTFAYSVFFAAVFGPFCSLSYAADSRPILVIVGMQEEAKIAAGPGVKVVISAGNPTLLEQRLAHYSRENVRAVISMGIAGGLDPVAVPGNLYISKQVVAPGGTDWPTDASLDQKLAEAAKAAGLTAFHGKDAGIDGLSATNPAGREALRSATGAAIVDNESQHAAAFAEHEGLPFAVVRVVADPANFTLPPAALLPLKPDGTPDDGAIFGSIVKDPGQIGALTQVQKQEEKALASLKKIREHIHVPSL